MTKDMVKGRNHSGHWRFNLRRFKKVLFRGYKVTSFITSGMYLNKDPGKMKARSLKELIRKFALPDLL